MDCLCSLHASHIISLVRHWRLLKYNETHRQGAFPLGRSVLLCTQSSVRWCAPYHLPLLRRVPPCRDFPDDLVQGCSLHGPGCQRDCKHVSQLDTPATAAVDRAHDCGGWAVLGEVAWFELNIIEPYWSILNLCWFEEVDQWCDFSWLVAIPDSHTFLLSSGRVVCLIPIMSHHVASGSRAPRQICPPLRIESWWYPEHIWHILTYFDIYHCTVQLNSDCIVVHWLTNVEHQWANHDRFERSWWRSWRMSCRTGWLWWSRALGLQNPSQRRCGCPWGIWQFATVQRLTLQTGMRRRSGLDGALWSFHSIHCSFHMRYVRLHFHMFPTQDTITAYDGSIWMQW